MHAPKNENAAKGGSSPKAAKVGGTSNHHKRRDPNPLAGVCKAPLNGGAK
jgi:hypothetical protein